MNLEEGIEIPNGIGETVSISRKDDFSTLVFSGFLDCPTVCATSLPWLEKIVSESPPNQTKVVFLDLSETENPSGLAKLSARFPHIQRVKPDAKERHSVLEKLRLVRSNTNHHSSRLFIHRAGSSEMEWVDRVDSLFYANWSKMRPN